MSTPLGCSGALVGELSKARRIAPGTQIHALGTYYIPLTNTLSVYPSFWIAHTFLFLLVIVETGIYLSFISWSLLKSVTHLQVE